MRIEGLTRIEKGQRKERRRKGLLKGRDQIGKETRERERKTLGKGLLNKDDRLETKTEQRSGVDKRIEWN